MPHLNPEPIWAFECLQIPKSKADPGKANPAVGISRADFSATGRYLVTFNECQSKAVWVWDVQALSLACVLLHESPVRHLAMDPVEDRLAICTGSRRCESRLASFGSPWVPRVVDQRCISQQPR